MEEFDQQSISLGLPDSKPLVSDEKPYALQELVQCMNCEWNEPEHALQKCPKCELFKEQFEHGKFERAVQLNWMSINKHISDLIVADLDTGTSELKVRLNEPGIRQNELQVRQKDVTIKFNLDVGDIKLPELKKILIDELQKRILTILIEKYGRNTEIIAEHSGLGKRQVQKLLKKYGL